MDPILKAIIQIHSLKTYVKAQIRIRPSSELVQPDQNSDLGRPRSEFSSGLDQFRTGLAKIRILIGAGPDQNSLINNDK